MVPNTQSYDKLIEKWAPVLDEESAGKITDNHKKAVTAAVLENQEIALKEEGMIQEATNTTTTNTATTNWNPVLIALVRRAMPNLMAYDICGVQPMSGPTGLIFAMKSRYFNAKHKAGLGASATGTSAPEAMFDEVEQYSGDSAGVAANAATGPSGLKGIADGDGDSTIDDSRGDPIAGVDNLTTAEAEGLGASGNQGFAEMGFTIEKATVTAKSRALKAEYTLELAQDLKAIHGLDAETELANILSTEILAEINREVVRTINGQAKTGCLQTNTAINGIFNVQTDADGRWSVEKFKGLLFQIERDANRIAQRTRRGKGNMILCSADVASALTMAGVLDYTPALNSNLQVDDTGNTFAGVLQGKYRVYIDPYSANSAVKQYYVVGYKGSSPYDAGLFYCPYVPLQMVRAVGQDTFQPKIGFKTRYGMVANPFAEGLDQGLGRIKANSNRYYQRVKVLNLM